VNLYIEIYEGQTYLRKRYSPNIRTCVEDMKLTDDEFQIMKVLEFPKYRIHNPDHQFSIDKRQLL
jgi:hypothetical protein